MKKKGWLTVFAFLLFSLGLISLLLSMAGLQFVFMEWLGEFDTVYGFVVHLLMIVAGLVLMFVVRIDWDKERADLE